MAGITSMNDTSNAQAIVPILTYHSICTDANTNWRRYTLPPGRFAEHLRYLDENHFTAITVGEFVHLRATLGELPPRPVILTFDDGHGDFVATALPLLERYRMLATLYVTTGLVGQRSPWPHRRGEPGCPMVSWEQVREISARGVECGSHAVTHQPLDVIPRADALHEIVTSKRILEDQLAREVSTFCYPHGSYDAAVRAMVVGAGYTGACSCTRALSNLADDPFALARILVTYDTSLAELAALLAGHGLPHAPLAERFRTRAWRFARCQAGVLRRATRLRDGRRA